MIYASVVYPWRLTLRTRTGEWSHRKIGTIAQMGREMRRLKRHYEPLFGDDDPIVATIIEREEWE